MLRDDADATDNGHEIRITYPARDDVEVEVVLNSGARGLSQIPADIESLGFDAFLEQALGMNAEVPKFEHLVVGESRSFRRPCDRALPSNAPPDTGICS